MPWPQFLAALPQCWLALGMPRHLSYPAIVDDDDDLSMRVHARAGHGGGAHSHGLMRSVSRRGWLIEPGFRADALIVSSALRWNG